MIGSTSERIKMEPYALIFDALGFPQPLDVIPMPAEVARKAGLPLPEDLIMPIVHNMRSKFDQMKPPSAPQLPRLPGGF